jgi:hypothetical protein
MLTRMNMLAIVAAVAAVGAYALLRNTGDDARHPDVQPMGRLLTPTSSLKPIKPPAKPKLRKAAPRTEPNARMAESRPAPQSSSRPTVSQPVESRPPTPARASPPAKRPGTDPEQETTFGG